MFGELIHPLFALVTTVQGLFIADPAYYTTCAKVSCAFSHPVPIEQTFCITGRVLHISHTVSLSEITLQDDTGFCLITEAGRTSKHPGDIITASGFFSDINGPHPRANCTNTTFLMKGPAPTPQQVTAQEILSGNADWRLVCLRGTLQDIIHSELNKNWIVITLNCNGLCVHAATPNRNDISLQLTPFKDALVELAGVAIPLDGSPRTRIGRILHFADIRSLRSVSPPPADPFSVPDIKDIMARPASVISTLGRHSARGELLAVWGGNNGLLLTSDKTIVRLAFTAPTNLRPGDFITAVGLPESDLQHINLSDVITRQEKSASRTIQEPIDWPSNLVITGAFISQWYGHAVRMSGVLRAKPSTDCPDKLCYLDTGRRLVPIDFSISPDILSNIEIDSRIEVTGICVMEIENWRPRQTFPRVNGFFIVLQSGEHIRILARPPWWTPSRLTVVIGALLALLISALIWNTALRRIAARKGRELFNEQIGHVKADLRTEERTRLAVELHDTLAQNLTGVSMEIEAAHDLRGDAPQPMLDHLCIAAKALKSCRDELRNCLWDLRSQALEEPDMTKAVLKTLQPVVNDSRLAVRFNVPRARLSDNTAHALLRVIRELVVNAIRHGNASAIKVAGTIDNGKLLCSVTDDGCGFDPDTAPGVLQGHFGLQGIQERIDEIGGTFEISSTPGKGTKATISIPIPQPVI